MGAPNRDGSGRRPMPGRVGATNPGLAPVAAECEQKNAPFARTSADDREQLQLGRSRACKLQAAKSPSGRLVSQVSGLAVDVGCGGDARCGLWSSGRPTIV